MRSPARSSRIQHARCGAFTLGELLGVLIVLGVLMLLIGPLFIFEAPLRLAFGWVSFIARNLPRVSWSASGWGMFWLLLVAISAFSCGLAKYWSKRIGVPISRATPFAAMLSVVALFTAGIGATGVAHQLGWLLSSDEPWTEGHNPALYRMRDSQQQQKIGVGIRQFSDGISKSNEKASTDNQVFASSTLRSADGDLLHGWHTQLLPYLDEQPTFENVDLARAWNHPVNIQAMSTRVAAFLRKDATGFFRKDATRSLPQMSGSYAVSHCAANRLLFGDTNIRGFNDVTDGLANTVMAGNAAGQFLPWGHPLGWRDDEYLPNQDDRGFGSGFIGGCHILMADGTVKFVTDSIDQTLWRSLFTPQGGERIDRRF